ncbi:MAG: ATP synthase subunit C [Oscillospiraceae bacterium]|nr:ATP synthase subunit C [Oscillospiraceae bacterium]
MTYLLIALPIIALAASVFFGIKAFKNGKKSRNIVVKQLLAFMAIAVVTFAVPMVASAAEGETAADTQLIYTDGATVARQSDGLGLIAAGIVTGLSGIGGGIAVAAAAPAAIGATAEDPKAFGKSLIFVALGEGVALYGLLISILILAKVAV